MERRIWEVGLSLRMHIMDNESYAKAIMVSRILKIPIQKLEIYSIAYSSQRLLSSIEMDIFTDKIFNGKSIKEISGYMNVSRQYVNRVYLDAKRKLISFYNGITEDGHILNASGLGLPENICQILYQYDLYQIEKLQNAILKNPKEWNVSCRRLGDRIKNRIEFSLKEHHLMPNVNTNDMESEIIPEISMLILDKRSINYLQRAGIFSIVSLVEYIKENPYNWDILINGIGPVTKSKILDVLFEHHLISEETLHPEISEDFPVFCMDMSLHSKNILQKNNIINVRQLRDIIENNPDTWEFSIKGIGKETKEEIENTLNVILTQLSVPVQN